MDLRIHSLHHQAVILVVHGFHRFYVVIWRWCGVGTTDVGGGGGAAGYCHQHPMDSNSFKSKGTYQVSTTKIKLIGDVVLIQSHRHPDIIKCNNGGQILFITGAGRSWSLNEMLKVVESTPCSHRFLVLVVVANRLAVLPTSDISGGG